MNGLRGGTLCTCSCLYANSGGSSSSDNSNANYGIGSGGYSSGGCQNYTTTTGYSVPQECGVCNESYPG